MVLHRWKSLWLSAGLSMLMSTVINAEAAPADFIETAPSGAAEEVEIVTYPARFFDRYQPLTALDMVRQVPGFQIDDGDALRGFGGTVGNVLIDNRRPSAKQDLISAILARIPAERVARVELLRGEVQNVNVQGHSSLVNVVMDKGVEATDRWEAFMTYTSPAPLGLGASLSKSDRWSDIDYNFGLDVERYTNGITGTVERYNTAGSLTELRADKKAQTGLGISGLYLNASSELGGTLYHLNTKFAFRKGDGLEVSRRFPQYENQHNVFFAADSEHPQFELGIDGERYLNDELQGKAILLFAREHEEGISTQESVESTGARLEFKEAREEAKTTETIARLEFDWSGWTGHALSADIEGAYNVLDNALAVTENSGAGAVIVDVPNGNSRIEEVRGDILFNDIWSPGRWSLDYGLGAEVSTLTQTGDADQQRTFIYIKPKILLSFTPNPFRQSSLRLEREVAQLNFNDFVSTTVFVDNDLALGNPNLKPETTWIAELTHERRFGAQGVVSLKGFHHWIKDVMDLLPVSDKYEVPGNVGDGRRWGMEAAGTMPLDWLNLAGARLNIKLRWQDSAVKDPVTGEDRRLSADGGFSGPPTIHFRSDNEYVVDIAFRQDRENSAWAWGWDTAFQADRTLFRVNELERFEEGVELNSFVETTRWLGMKIRLEGRNLLDYLEVRDRLAYAGRRGLSAIQRRELRLRKPGRIFTITFSGVF